MITGIDQGFTADFQAYPGQLFCDVYLEDQKYKIARSVAFTPGATTVSYTDEVLTNGQTYFAVFWTLSQGLRSPRTDFLEFVPAACPLTTEAGETILTEAGEAIVI